ncbi:MAG: Fe-S cluster assembly protein SufD [Candidatus Tokpelaia sp. JSC188]|nr:MAG: Fe-S cluster assembly protein SufD [Candidatus Tokpelaia sp. JSC188]
MIAGQKTILTQAEAKIIDNFAVLKGEMAQRGLLLEAARKAAMDSFCKNGFPSKQMESWHYTDMRTKLIHIASCNNTKADRLLAFPLLPNNIVLGLINGQAVVSPEMKWKKEMLCATPLDKLLTNSQAELPQDFADDNVIAQINTAFVSNGWKLDILENVSLDKIIELQNIQNGGQSHVRFPVTVGKNANVTIIERQSGNNEDSFISSVSNLDTAEGSQVLWIIIRERGLMSSELNQFNAQLGKNVVLKLYVIHTGSHFLRQEINVNLNGIGADFQLREINLLSGKTHTDTTMVVRHLAENTTSKEIIRNVAMDRACGVFQGIIQVVKEAKKTDAHMVCNSLILSDKAEFYTKPQLEIFAEDVSCGHGATVSEIDHDQLFYLMARGIPEVKARAILVEAFFRELIEELDKEKLRKVLWRLLDECLQAHI